MATAQESITESYNLIDGKMEVCPKNKGKYITHNYLSYGDYDNSGSVERSNVTYIIENYASNRYHLVVGWWGYNHIYLKNTAINAELICGLSEYASIDDDYLYKWEETEAKKQFLDNSLSNYKELYKALELHFENDPTIDPSMIENSEYFWELFSIIRLEFDTYYHFENSVCVFRSNNYDKDQVINLCLEYYAQNAVIKPLSGDELLNKLSPIAYRLMYNSKNEDVIYTMVVYTYTCIDCLAGSSDYLFDHTYPFYEIEIDKSSSYETILSSLIASYEHICDYAYEQLDKLV
jgi:hypothetical protein